MSKIVNEMCIWEYILNHQNYLNLFRGSLCHYFKHYERLKKMSCHYIYKNVYTRIYILTERLFRRYACPEQRFTLFDPPRALNPTHTTLNPTKGVQPNPNIHQTIIHLPTNPSKAYQRFPQNRDIKTQRTENTTN